MTATPWIIGRVFLTAGEIALGGVGIGGLISMLTAQITLRSGRKGDHAETLWERQTELYDEVVREARKWQLDRGPSGSPTEITQQDIDRTEDTRIRFQMFGQHDVERCYIEHFDRHWEWVGWVSRRRTAMETNRLVMAEESHPNNATSADDLLTMAASARDARAKADAAAEALMESVRGAVYRVPKLKRRDARAALKIRRS